MYTHVCKFSGIVNCFKYSEVDILFVHGYVYV